MNREERSQIQSTVTGTVGSRLLSNYPQLCAGVSMRIGGVSHEPYGLNLSLNVGDIKENVVENRKRFFAQMGIPVDALAIPRQVHGDSVGRADKPGSYDTCDALISNRPNVFLVVTVADCLPIFLFDPTTGSIGCVHTGWRGSRLRILERTLKALEKEFETKPEDIIAYIGPSAGVCCYEIGEEVAREFPEAFMLRMPNQKPHLDLKMANKHLLLEAGVRRENIEVHELCTICNPRVFHSYRRDGPKSGRMMGVIGIKGIES